jgi:hypothetical protein
MRKNIKESTLCTPLLTNLPGPSFYKSELICSAIFKNPLRFKWGGNGNLISGDGGWLRRQLRLRGARISSGQRLPRQVAALQLMSLLL